MSTPKKEHTLNPWLYHLSQIALLIVIIWVGQLYTLPAWRAIVIGMAVGAAGELEGAAARRKERGGDA